METQQAQKTESVSAAPAQQAAANPSQSLEIELRLIGKSPLRRCLDLGLSRYGRLTVSMFALGKYQMFAYATEKLSACHLTEYGGKFSLWVGSTAFNVSVEEARRIGESFESLGLKVEKIAPYKERS